MSSFLRPSHQALQTQPNSTQPYMHARHAMLLDRLCFWRSSITASSFHPNRCQMHMFSHECHLAVCIFRTPLTSMNCSTQTCEYLRVKLVNIPPYGPAVAKLVRTRVDALCTFKPVDHLSARRIQYTFRLQTLCRIVRTSFFATQPSPHPGTATFSFTPSPLQLAMVPLGSVVPQILSQKRDLNPILHKQTLPEASSTWTAYAFALQDRGLTGKHGHCIRLEGDCSIHLLTLFI